MHGFFRKAGAVLVAVGIGVVGMAVTAKADAPDPIKASGSLVVNADGTKTLTITGTWQWPTHRSDCNTNRFGVGWAVDWNDTSQPGNTIGQVNNAGAVIDVGAAAANLRNPADNTVKYAPQFPYCGTYDAAAGYNSGLIYATSHTYPSTQTTFNACLVTYDIHGKGTQPPPDPKELIAGGNGRNNDNSVEKNGNTPGGNQCMNITPPPADLTIVKTDDNARFTVGQNGLYKVRVTHVAGAVTGDITVTDSLPTGLTFVSASGTGWTCPGTVGAQSFTCVRPSGGLSGGASTPDINITVAVGSAAVGTVTNTATVSNPSDTNATNNTATEPTPVDPAAPGPDLTIVKADDDARFTVGQNGAYKIRVTHVAGTVTGDITVTDSLPNGLTLLSAAGTGWNCTGSAGGSSFTCVRPSGGLSGGASTPDINVVVAVGSAAVGTVINTAIVSNPSDTNPNNNRDDESTPVDPAPAGPDLSIVKADADATFTVGQNGSYTIRVTHVAGTVTGDITVTDSLPNGLTLVSASGTGWSCSGTAGATAFSCVRPSGGLSGGASTPDINVVVAVGAAAVGSVTNAAVVTNPSDTNPNNNRDEESTPVNPAPASPDLTIVKDDAGANFTVGQTGTYQITVKHVAGTITGPITVTDQLPDGLTMVSAAGTGWTCSWGTTNLTCTRGPEGMSGGAFSPPINVTVNVGQAAAAQVLNTAILSNPSDTNAGNNRDDELTTVIRPPTGVVAAPAAPAPVDYRPAARNTLPATGGGFGGTVRFGLLLVLAGLAMCVRRPQRVRAS